MHIDIDTHTYIYDMMWYSSIYIQMYIYIYMILCTGDRRDPREARIVCEATNWWDTWYWISILIVFRTETCRTKYEESRLKHATLLSNLDDQHFLNIKTSPPKRGEDPHKLFIKWYSARPIGQSWSVRSAKLYSTLVAVMIFGSWGTHELWVSNHSFSGESITAIYSMQISVFSNWSWGADPSSLLYCLRCVVPTSNQHSKAAKDPNHCPWTSPI